MESEKHQEIQDIFDKTVTAQVCCSAVEYLNGDNDLPVCVELDNDTWEDNFFLQILKVKVVMMANLRNTQTIIIDNKLLLLLS